MPAINVNISKIAHKRLRILGALQEMTQAQIIDCLLIEMSNEEIGEVLERAKRKKESEIQSD